ncbi:hypothetical protein K431DRAFT_288392 [Polychaeton citri CBS 116435]|uniref:Uncharacterized protein n=1 Tax=Polychaeton citri CBS 116435 TaxID=1314669 RepID=A0A9P4PZ31_9PEZI|nr:hypothetical protein K431DRAFT_288392 [Polychaeton citri CBS 116435]
MSPIRRYLRITKYSVLEVRIYLDKPSDAPWLLSSRDNVLDRIIAAIKPKVLPKLREENENARSKSNSAAAKRKRGIKDVVAGEDFEVSIFLQEHSSRHSLLTKRKEFGEKKERLRSNGKGLAGWIGGRGGEQDPVVLVEEPEGGNIVDLRDIPEAKDGKGDDEALFVSSSDEEGDVAKTNAPPRKRRRRNDPQATTEENSDATDGADGGDDKKKLAMSTTYDGFSIYGWILCLVVKRRGVRQPLGRDSEPIGGSQMMEQWVSTQAAQEADLEEDVEG